MSFPIIFKGLEQAPAPEDYQAYLYKKYCGYSKPCPEQTAKERLAVQSALQSIATNLSKTTLGDCQNGAVYLALTKHKNIQELPSGSIEDLEDIQFSLTVLAEIKDLTLAAVQVRGTCWRFLTMTYVNALKNGQKKIVDFIENNFVKHQITLKKSTIALIESLEKFDVERFIWLQFIAKHVGYYSREKINDKIADRLIKLYFSLNKNKAIKQKIELDWKILIVKKLYLDFIELRIDDEVMTNAEVMTDAEVILVLENLENLKNLNYIYLGWTKITNQSLQKIAEKCPGLKSLILPSCQQITDQGVKEVAEKCLKLESLDLTFCHQITSQSLGEITEKCRMRKPQFDLVLTNY